MEHSLPPLAYEYNALAPHISGETMTLHHSKHHQTYVTNLNNLIKDTEYAAMSLEQIVRQAPAGGIFNNAGQHWNHVLFWESLAPNAGGEADGALADAIKAAFGSFADFQAAFEKCGAATFGSGWAWLVAGADGKVELLSTSNADNPLRHGKTALLGVDVWEHAYYVDYRNRRPDYLKAIWNVVNWDKVGERYAALGG